MQWRIEMLGGLRAVQGHQVLTRFRTQKTSAILAYLAYYLQRTRPARSPTFIPSRWRTNCHVSVRWVVV